mmetsp:Transcript_19588/g.55980  ORF Transcript_19588/g.55980 Transcript_19588/m.55980 type:complete len:215 (-) Transcript_19588:328-972(-)
MWHLREREDFTQQLLHFLADEAALDAETRVRKGLADVVLDALAPDAAMPLLEEAVDEPPALFPGVVANLALGLADGHGVAGEALLHGGHGIGAVPAHALEGHGYAGRAAHAGHRASTGGRAAGRGGALSAVRVHVIVELIRGLVGSVHAIEVEERQQGLSRLRLLDVALGLFHVVAVAVAAGLAVQVGVPLQPQAPNAFLLRDGKRKVTGRPDD